MVQQAVGLSVGGVISRSFSIWLKNIVPFSILALIIESPVILFCMFVPPDSSVYGAVGSYGPAALSLVTSAAVAFGVFQQLRGQPVTLGQCVSVGLSRLLPVIGVALCVAVMFGVGLVLFVIPGIIVACVFYVAVPAAVVERVGVGQALGRSKFLTQGSRGSIFVIAFVLGLVTGCIGLLIHFMIPGPSAPLPNFSEPAKYLEAVKEFTRDHASTIRFQTVIGLIAGAVLGCLQSVASVVIYYDLRVQKEQVDIEKIVAVFG